MSEPTLILRNARAITFDPAAPRASAVALAGDRILAVGGEEVAGLATPSTEVIDLGGSTLIPGFNDAHAHMEREGLKRLRPSLAGARSVGDILERVRAAAAETPPGQWIVTMPIGTPPFFFDGAASLAFRKLLADPSTAVRQRVLR